MTRLPVAIVLAVAAAFAATPAVAQPLVAPSSAAQDDRDFNLALQAAQLGDYNTAIRQLSALAAATDAPRIRLELARVYFEAHEYRRAKDQFLDVYHRDIPYPVRRTINLYLDDIDQRIGYLRPRLGVVIDNNPTQQPQSGTYEILGFPLTFERDEETTYGIAYGLDGLLPLARRDLSTWQLVGGIDGVAYPEVDGADRKSATAGLRYDEGRSHTRVTLGWRGYETPSLRSSAPFVEYYRRWTPKRDRQFAVQASVEVNRFPERRDLRGETGRVTVSYVRDITPITSVQLAAGGSLSSIEDTIVPQSELYGRVAAARTVSRLNVNLIAGLTASESWYGLSDPFFGKTREDQALRVDLSGYLARPVMGFFPGVVLSGEQRWSTIGFYQYRRGGVSVDFRRRF